MRSTVATSAVQTQPNDLLSDSDDVRARLGAIRSKQAKAQIDPNLKEILPVIRRAMGKTGLSQKAMAIAARCTESELSEALNGRDGRRFDADWIWRQDDTFVVAFLDEVTETRGLTPENRNAIRRARIVELIGLLLQDVA